MTEINHLVIVSHVIHYQWDNALHSYGPYAREIDIWADLFAQVTIAAPLRHEKPPSDCLSFGRVNIDVAAQRERGGDRWQDKLVQVFSLPFLLAGLCRAMKQADAIQVRCPGNLGLLGLLLAPLFSRYRVAKYAGQWVGYRGEAWSYRLQRGILRSAWWKAPVLVYGKWPDQPAHVIPFFTSILEDRHLQDAQKSAEKKQLHQPLRILFVGRLSREKNAHVLLAALAREGNAFECRVIGDGVMRSHLEEQVKSMGLNVKDVMIGALPFEKVLQHYAWADVLVLASESEGWPKAVAEAMAFGVVCIGSNRGLMPQMLADGRGLVVEPGDEMALFTALQDIATGRCEFESTSRKAAIWAQHYSLAGFQRAIRELLLREWQLTDDALKALP